MLPAWGRLGRIFEGFLRAPQFEGVWHPHCPAVGGAAIAAPAAQRCAAAAAGRRAASDASDDDSEPLPSSRWDPEGADAAGAPHYRHPYAPLGGGGDESDVGQRRATGRLEAAIEAALLADAVVRAQLVERHGVAIHRVRLARNRRTAHILWDANPGAAAAAEAALQRCAFRLRRHVAKVMRSRHTPYLEFRHDRLPPRQACVAAAIERVEREAAAEADAEARWAADAGWAAAGTQRAAAAALGPAAVPEAAPGAGDAGRPGDSGRGAGGRSGQGPRASDGQRDLRIDRDLVNSAIRDLEERLPPRKRYAKIVRQPEPEGDV
jgi:ribosome-binding factor A